MNGKFNVIALIFICTLILTSCAGNDTYRLAKKMREYKLHNTGYEDTLKMATKGNYDANCKDCFRGIDSKNISLFAYSCEVDLEFAKAIYDSGADIESANNEFYQTPLLSALDGNRNNPEIVYWLIDKGANINTVDYNNCCVFNYLRFWEDNDETQGLIEYFKENCDLKYLKENTVDNPLCNWDDMWGEDGEFIFY